MCSELGPSKSLLKGLAGSSPKLGSRLDHISDESGEHLPDISYFYRLAASKCNVALTLGEELQVLVAVLHEIARTLGTNGSPPTCGQGPLLAPRSDYYQSGLLG